MQEDLLGSKNKNRERLKHIQHRSRTANFKTFIEAVLHRCLVLSTCISFCSIRSRVTSSTFYQRLSRLRQQLSLVQVFKDSQFLLYSNTCNTFLPCTSCLLMMKVVTVLIGGSATLLPAGALGMTVEEHPSQQCSKLCQRHL